MATGMAVSSMSCNTESETDSFSSSKPTMKPAITENTGLIKLVHAGCHVSDAYSCFF